MNKKKIIDNLKDIGIASAIAVVVGLPIFNHFRNDPDFYFKSGYCSAYATRTTEKEHGFKYERTHAWNLKDYHKTIDTEGKNIDEIAEIAQPGHLLGIFYPKSNHNQDGRAYTHIAIYEGVDSEGKIIINHNFKGIKKEKLEDFLCQYNCELKELILPERKS